ncbi:CD99 molecule isoform X2 [Archocentrus centrarchus]|uniref:CD99 molecule isoform X2 n=1 Tax=Archocentrus centrarchus TaxID=63155 RepID=UPI0011E9CD43|nr:CD99 antigen-like protein 2 isoform X2 [Archocentrus centrarchus]
MKFCLRILLLFFLVTGTVTQDFDLFDALDDPPPTPAKPKEPPKPPKDPGLDGGLDLSDAFGPDEPQTKKPEKPNSGDSGDAGFDLGDALKPDPNAKPDKPAVKPPSGGGGGGGSFDDSDLASVGGGGDYKPDGGRSGGRAMDPQGGADPPQDPDFLWGQIQKMLNTNFPEEFYVWLSNLKQIVTPLLERAMELLQALP